MKGTYQGIVGLVVKPVAGVLDAASKTAEGIKNTATYFDQKPNEQRSRYPRAFYGKEQFYRQYIESDAEVTWHFHDSNKDKLRDLCLLNSFDVFPDEDDKEHYFILALAQERVIYWNPQKTKLIWDFPTSDLSNVSLSTDKVEIQLAKPNEKTKVSFDFNFLIRLGHCFAN
jgi:vacuolar protein sorting-associated protein 13A/C